MAHGAPLRPKLGSCNALDLGRNDGAATQLTRDFLRVVACIGRDAVAVRPKLCTPRMFDDATEKPADDLPAIIDGRPMRTNGKRILIVEDDQTLAITLRDAFRAEGAVVLGPAPTVFYARHLIGRRGIDCAIISSDLPGDEGEHFVTQLASSGTPIITLSRHANAHARAQKALMRPVEASAVVDSVAALLTVYPDDNNPIELKSERAVKALGLDDNPHMRVVRIWTEAMRRQADEQTQEFL